jgi:hypothetical protein
VGVDGVCLAVSIFLLPNRTDHYRV